MYVCGRPSMFNLSAEGMTHRLFHVQYDRNTSKIISNSWYFKTIYEQEALSLEKMM